jgi:hypothetical protein
MPPPIVGSVGEVVGGGSAEPESSDESEELLPVPVATNIGVPFSSVPLGCSGFDGDGPAEGSDDGPLEGSDDVPVEGPVPGSAGGLQSTVVPKVPPRFTPHKPVTSFRLIGSPNTYE